MGLYSYMPRYKLIIEYDGTPFHGWQKQPCLPTVQETIEKAILKLSGETVVVEGSGRTDTGVHARGQVAHIDLDKTYQEFKIRDALNFFMKDQGISIINVETVSEDFHARFSAKQRCYHYHILNRRSPSPLLSKRAWHIPQPLDINLMNKACQRFIGHHDFQSFRSTECQANHALRTIDECFVEKQDDMVILTVKGKSFLHNQVRITTGTLKQIGLGRLALKDLDHIFSVKDRTKSGPTAPAHGLYFDHVSYIAEAR